MIWNAGKIILGIILPLKPFVIFVYFVVFFFFSGVSDWTTKNGFARHNLA